MVLYSNIDPIHVRFADNGKVKYAVLSGKTQGEYVALQGKMVEDLYKEWKLKLGSFGPSDSFLKKEEPTLYNVKLTKGQLEALHRLIDQEGY